MDINKIKGIIPPIITPIKENEDVDESGFRKLLDHCVDKGLHGIFVAGTNGETMALTQEQRNKAIKIAIDEVGGRVPVICGVMDSSTRRVIENIKALEQMGGEIAAVTPVFYARHACEQEILRHFEEVARSTKLSIMLYNIPPFTGTTIAPETIFEAAKIDNVIGYKDSSGSIVQFQKCLQHFKGTSFKLFMGATDLAGISLLMGADGFVPALAPVFYDVFLKMYEAAVEKDIQKTLALNEIVCKTGRILKMSQNATSATKYAISLLGFTSKQVIRPCEPITEEEEKRIKELIDSILKDQ